MKRFTLSTLLFFALVSAYSQTPISGLINGDTILRAVNSPYLVSSNLIIAPNSTLTVESGVIIRFASGVGLEVRGTLIANGTSSDSITFTSNSTMTKSSWSGVSIKNTQGGNATFKYCKFLYASKAIDEECCQNTNNKISNSRFTSNNIAIGGYSGGNQLPIDSCLFTYNTYCLLDADKRVEYSTFLYNDYGLYQTERINVFNSIFKFNTQVALYGGRGELVDCIIEENNTGVKFFYEGFRINHCTISNNNTGVELNSYGSFIAPIDSSKICHNTLYNIKNNSSYNADVYGNCWCTSASGTIESKILDGKDNSSLGLVSYDIFNNTCDTFLSKVDKTITTVNKWTLANSPYIISANHVVFPNDTLIIDPGVVVRFASGVGLEVRGTLIANGTSSDSITFTSNSTMTKSSWSGISIKNTQGGNATFKYCKFLYASTAIDEECCQGGNNKVSNSRFTSNNTAIGGYGGRTMPVDSCLFTYNTYCLTAADKTIRYSTFLNNDYGLYQTERISVFNSIFRFNTQVALYGGRGEVVDCIIEENNTGVKFFYEGFRINHCTISNNNTGVELNSYGSYIAPIDSSKICNNTLYNVKNNSSYDAVLNGNCWCTSVSGTIDSKILDGKDNSSLGLVSYDIFTNDCDSLLPNVDTTITHVTRWTLVNSPYIISTNYVVFPNDTLIIDPGVVVRFANGIGLEVRGTLIANGTSSDSITFTSNSAMTKSSWSGVSIKNTQGGNATFKYCKFLYASTAIDEECCQGGNNKVSNSRFTSNNTAIGGYGGRTMPVDSCLFTYNTYCLTAADKTIRYSTFLNNDYGLYQTERISVFNSIFRFNTQVALYGGRGELVDCIIEENNTGVKFFYEGFNIKHCTISNNNIGVELSAYGSVIAPIDSSKICHNTLYNVKNNSFLGAQLYTNCWCIRDSSVIEDKLYDGLDDPSRGLLDYIMYTTDCLYPVFKTNKGEDTVYYLNTTINDNILIEKLVIYPNPTAGLLNIENLNTITQVKVFDNIGRLVLVKDVTPHSDRMEIDMSEYRTGLYIIKAKDIHQNEGSYKISVRNN